MIGFVYGHDYSLVILKEKKPEVDYNKAIDDVLTNVRLNFDSVEKQIGFLKEGMKLAREIPESSLLVEKCTMVKTPISFRYFCFSLIVILILTTYISHA